MKIDFTELKIVRGDIEMEHEITREQFDQFHQIITHCKTTPMIRLTLIHKEDQIKIELQNWEKRY